MSSKAKRKGTRVENEIVKLFQAEGFNARRQPLSGAIAAFPHDVQVSDLFQGTNIEVKARKNGEGFAQLDKWKGSADLLVLKKDFSNPMVYLDWDLFKEFCMSIDKTDDVTNLENRQLFHISLAERRKLRQIVRKVHLKFLPEASVTDRECDKLIESLGPKVRERLLREAIDKNLV